MRKEKMPTRPRRRWHEGIQKRSQLPPGGCARKTPTHNKDRNKKNKIWLPLEPIQKPNFSNYLI